MNKFLKIFIALRRFAQLREDRLADRFYKFLRRTNCQCWVRIYGRSHSEDLTFSVSPLQPRERFLKFADDIYLARADALALISDVAGLRYSLNYSNAIFGQGS